MYYSCHEHVDIALDETVDESGMPPEMDVVQENSADVITKCSFCENKAKYIIKTVDNSL
ncbi:MULTISPECIES: CxxH/CxxC protein [Bacillaceae]|uniref:CxxH/CxxC protein n=1 Tax=Evansella alkalicola TaxID=745819 RepID=A0ABS6JUW6_9BACI|nr:MULTISPECIES: CxxH/CxxC protein [Bacillaceae]MBU9722331.1 CxxH/CxxC protein [Bacillus alkalicola]